MEPQDFFVEELLDLPNVDEMMCDSFFDTSVVANSADSYTVTAVDRCNSSLSGGADNRFLPNHSFSDAGELCVPLFKNDEEV